MRRSMSTLTAAAIQQIPHLGSLSTADAQHLLGEIAVRTYQARELVANEGEPCRGMFFVVSGRARLFRTGPDGREQILRLIQAGDTFGEVAVFDDGPTPASVETLDTTEIAIISSATFRRLVDTHPGVARDLLHHFARRLRSFTELIEQMGLQTVQQRVARYIYMTAREEGIETAEGVVIARSITLYDMAALVGSVREVVSRTLHALEADGVVVIRRKEIVVLDLAALRRLI